MEERNNQGAEKLTVWLGIFGRKIVGPFYFKTSVNGERYFYMLQNMVGPQLNEMGWPHYFMHDGAPPHITNPVRNWLDQNFPNQWIGRFGPIPWAPRSPDLNPLDFFLWGSLKNKVFQNSITTLDDLKVN